MERLVAGCRQEVFEMREEFKKLRRQFRSAARKNQVFPEEKMEEMLALDARLASMETGWRRNFPPEKTDPGSI